jgi:hypothetical protein
MQKALLELSAVNGTVFGSLTLQDVNQIASAVGIISASIFSIVRTVMLLRDRRPGKDTD